MIDEAFPNVPGLLPIVKCPGCGVLVQSEHPEDGEQIGFCGFCGAIFTAKTSGETRKMSTDEVFALTIQQKTMLLKAAVQSLREIRLN